MGFRILPIDMIAVPNAWAVASSGVWQITDPNASVLWFQLSVEDSLGLRPYAPAVGATLQVTFRRADLIEQDDQRRLARTHQNVTKMGTFNAQNRALGSFSLTAQDVALVTSGAGFFTLLESGVTTQWIQDWLLKKVLTNIGF